MSQVDMVCVRRLTTSDLGWFGVHRARTRSKQRAININSNAANRLLSQQVLDAGGAELDCRCIYPGAENLERRRLWKVGKNWRLGGRKLEGDVLAKVTSGDFVVLRTRAPNDGTQPVQVTFVSALQDPETHSWLSGLVSLNLEDSVLLISEDERQFAQLTQRLFHDVGSPEAFRISAVRDKPIPMTAAFPTIPRNNDVLPHRARTMHDRVRSPHILAEMLKVSGDLSADAHHEFLRVLELLAGQLRTVLLATGGISAVKRDHRALWSSVREQRVAFVDGGMANLSMLGATPIAARVGGYIVTPGRSDGEREQFVMVKHLIDELYFRPPDTGVYGAIFPDLGALRDAARICVEAAGAVQIVESHSDIRYLFVHGALVNPVSRYTDIMEGGQSVAEFPSFSRKALEVLLPEGDRDRTGKDANFVRVYLRQLQLMLASGAIVCGVVERESEATSVYKALVNRAIVDPRVSAYLPMASNDWGHWFVERAEQFRVTDALLFRCVLEPGEYLQPVEIDRNERRRAPAAWASDIAAYPKPWVSYLLPSEWGAPLRMELFDKGCGRFEEVVRLLMHCAWLLPRYAFPVGLDIVDKYAKVPNWMARPVNTNTAVQALRRALEAGDSGAFDAMRRLLCGSTRDWLFRPKAF
jgi:hypothetical protein